MKLLARSILTRANIQRQCGSIVEALNPLQATYLEEPCIRVNEMDEPMGMISKMECHRNPILHRAFSVFIFNAKKQLLLQQRSPSKITFPNVWTNACCSHPHFNEFEIDSTNESIGVRRAAQRKLLHELGIVEEVENMHVMGRFIYKAISDSIWSEHELDYAIVVPNFEGQMAPNLDEVCDVRFVEKTELAGLMADSRSVFSPWFNLFAKFKWLDLWWSNLNDLNKMKDMKNIHKLN